MILNYRGSIREVTHANFGLLIAYVIPGFVVISGLSLHVAVLQHWMVLPASSLPSIGGLLFTTLYAILAGIFVSTIRWLVIDSLHATAGRKARNLDFSELQDRVDGYETIVGNTYRYYQHYANMLVAAPTAWLFTLAAFGWNTLLFLALIAFEFVYWRASTDTLQRYHHRTSMLLGESATQGQPRPKVQQR